MLGMIQGAHPPESRHRARTRESGWLVLPPRGAAGLCPVARTLAAGRAAARPGRRRPVRSEASPHERIRLGSALRNRRSHPLGSRAASVGGGLPRPRWNRALAGAGGWSRCSVCRRTANRRAWWRSSATITAANSERSATRVGGTATRRSRPSVRRPHLFEREIAEQCGVVPEGHPWLKPLRRHPPDHLPARSTARGRRSRGVSVLSHRGRRDARGRGRTGPRRRDRARPLSFPGARRGRAVPRDHARLPASRCRAPARVAAGRARRCWWRSRSPATP